MKNILILLSLILMFGCNHQTSYEDIYLESQEEDSLVQIEYEDVIISKDSILKLVERAMRQLEFKENIRKDMIVQIKKQMENEELTKHQIEDLQKQSYIYEEQSQIYKQQIEEISIRRVIEKDSIVYNIQYRDTIICKPVYIPDTIIIEVLDTVIVKKLSKKKRKKKKIK